MEGCEGRPYQGVDRNHSFHQHAAFKTIIASGLSIDLVYLESEIRSELHFEDIVGNSKDLNLVLRGVETVAPPDSTVWIYGETGTGQGLGFVVAIRSSEPAVP